MKRLILFLMVLGFAVPAFSQEFRARYTARRDIDTAIAVPPSDGSLQAAAREGNVLQAVNPAAPAGYGSGEKFVAYDEGSPFMDAHGRPRPVALRLFAVVW